MTAAQSEPSYSAMARDRREAVAGVGEGRLAKPARGKGGRKLDAERTERGTESRVSAARAKQMTGTESQGWSYVSAPLPTDRMVSAPGNGVREGNRLPRKTRAPHPVWRPGRARRC